MLPKRNRINNYTSIYGITFVICVYTGIILEYYVSERCIDDDLCPNHLTPATPCQRGKFHGNATGLEVASAKALFTKNRNDKECRFKYTTYVGDGDSAVGKEVLNDPDVKKRRMPIPLS